jgi:outer membrane receptor protein involved in Fe transport
MTTTRRTFVISSALFASIVAAPLAAQQADSTKLRRDSAYVLNPIEAVGTIAPTASPKIGSGIPARISVVGGDEIDAWEPRLLTDALQTQAGFSLYDDLGSPWKTSLVTRGFSAGPVLGLPQGVSVFLDGVRQNEPDAAEVNFDLLPLEHVKRVEFLHGTASLLGPNSLGGAINLITRRGSGPLSADVEASAGTYGQASGEASLGASGKAGDIYLAGGYERESGWRDATDARQGDVFLNLGRLRADRGITFQGMYAASNVRAAGSLPEAIFLTAPRTNFTPGDFDDINQFQASVSAYRALPSGRLSATLYHRRSNAERFNVNQAPDPDVRSRTANRTVGANVDWRWLIEAAGRPLALRFGADGTVNRVDVRIFNESAGSAALTTNVRSPSGDISGYTIADLTLGRATLSAGLRYDYIRIPFRDLLDPGADTTNSYTRASPRGGVSVELGRGASAYASVGQSFRAPALLELTCADSLAPCPLPFALGDDPPLKPVVATSYEVGGQWQLGALAMDLSVYRTSVRDDIFFISSDAALFQGFFANIGNTRRDGVELGARYALGANTSVYANYAWTRATFRTAASLFSPRSVADPSSPIFGRNAVEPGDELPLVPDHQLHGGIRTALPSGFEVGLDARFVGPRWLRGDEANETTRLPSYLVADTRVAWHGGPWGVSAIVSNLWDHRYATFGTFNTNRQSGVVERFLTPGLPVQLRVRLEREIGG